MSYVNHLGCTLPFGRVLAADPQAARSEMRSLALDFEAAFNRFIESTGLQSTFSASLVSGEGFYNVELTIFETHGSHLSVPHLLYPIDFTKAPDVSEIEATVVQSIGFMVANEEKMKELWSETIDEISHLFVNRPQASLERVDFIVRIDGPPALHAEILLFRDDFSTTRSRRVASGPVELGMIVAEAILDHDENVAAMTVDGKPCHTRYITSLATKVADLIEQRPFDVYWLLDGEMRLNFQAADEELPFSSGSFHWTRGVLGCSLAMRNGRCWVDGERVTLLGFDEFPATTKAGSIGDPLAKFIEFEGLDFEANVAAVAQTGRIITVDLDMPVTKLI
jgi:hypothetical protein